MKLTDKQIEEVDNAIYEQVQENLDDLTVFEDYWHGLTCSDGTVLDINIYDGFEYGNKEGYTQKEEGLQCVVHFVDSEKNIDYSKPVWFDSKHLDGIDPNTNAQQMYGDIF